MAKYSVTNADSYGSGAGLDDPRGHGACGKLSLCGAGHTTACTSEPGPRAEFLPQISKPSQRCGDMLGGGLSFPRLSTTQAPSPQTVMRVADTFFFPQEQPTSCPYRKCATCQHTPPVPSSNWTPNPISPTPSAAVIPDWTTISSGLPVSTHQQLPTTLHRQPE